jgi:hypothetical protein
MSRSMYPVRALQPAVPAVIAMIPAMYVVGLRLIPKEAAATTMPTAAVKTRRATILGFRS